MVQVPPPNIQNANAPQMYISDDVDTIHIATVTTTIKATITANTKHQKRSTSVNVAAGKKHFLQNVNSIPKVHRTPEGYDKNGKLTI